MTWVENKTQQCVNQPPHFYNWLKYSPMMGVQKIDQP